MNDRKHNRNNVRKNDSKNKNNKNRINKILALALTAGMTLSGPAVRNVYAEPGTDDPQVSAEDVAENQTNVKGRNKEETGNPTETEKSPAEGTETQQGNTLTQNSENDFHQDAAAEDAVVEDTAEEDEALEDAAFENAASEDVSSEEETSENAGEKLTAEELTGENYIPDSYARTPSEIEAQGGNAGGPRHAPRRAATVSALAQNQALFNQLPTDAASLQLLTTQADLKSAYFKNPADTDYPRIQSESNEIRKAVANLLGTEVTVRETVQNVPMYRLYNPNSGEHFYTASTVERDYLDSIGWNYENIGWYAPNWSNTPVYRVYNPNNGDHHYTTSLTEQRYLTGIGWKDEGVGWYSDDNHAVPLYRQFNPNAQVGSHNYTSSKVENDYLVSVGWRGEDIGWYGCASESYIKTVQQEADPVPAETKARTIYQYVVNNVGYDRVYASNPVKYSSQRPKDDAVGVLQTRIAVCEGYASLLCAMLRAAGIPAVKIDGFANFGGLTEDNITKSANHAWAAAYFEKDGVTKWWLMDPTWESKKYKSGSGIAGPDVSESQFHYYCISLDDLSKTRRFDNFDSEVLPAGSRIVTEINGQTMNANPSLTLSTGEEVSFRAYVLPLWADQKTSWRLWTSSNAPFEHESAIISDGITITLKGSREGTGYYEYSIQNLPRTQCYVKVTG